MRVIPASSLCRFGDETGYRRQTVRRPCERYRTPSPR